MAAKLSLRHSHLPGSAPGLRCGACCREALRILPATAAPRASLMQPTGRDAAPAPSGITLIVEGVTGAVHADNLRAALELAPVLGVVELLEIDGSRARFGLAGRGAAAQAALARLAAYLGARLDFATAENVVLRLPAPAAAAAASEPAQSHRGPRRVQVRLTPPPSAGTLRRVVDALCSTGRMLDADGSQAGTLVLVVEAESAAIVQQRLTDIQGLVATVTGGDVIQVSPHEAR